MDEKRKELIILIVLTFVLVNLVFLFSYKYVLYSKSFHVEEFEKNGVYSKFNQTSVDDEHDNIMEYLLTGRTSVISERLSEQDKLHLKDVKQLMKNVDYYSYVTVGFIFLLFWFLHFRHKKLIDKLFSKAIFITGIVNVVLLFILYLLSRNFNLFFIKFHEITFNNDLWMMNPNVDLLVQLYPQQFWIDAFSKIMFMSMTISVMFIVIGGLGWYFINKKMKKLPE
ncbi:MAG: TIGR01906 family membrane protein [Candidatus Woesearchaeota archaeon]